MNLVDTSGWLEYFFGGPNALHFRPAIETTGSLLVPTVCLYEVFKKINQVADEAKALEAVAHMKQGSVTSLDEPIALRASLISLKHRIPMADSFIYSTALAFRATLWTQDDHFRGLPGVKHFETKSAPRDSRRTRRGT